MLRIAVIGLGYVGLPVAVALGRKHSGLIGFDVSLERISELQAGLDSTGEVSAADLAASKIELSAEPAKLKAANFFIIAVPTPIDEERRPDLRKLISATEYVAQALKPGDIVVYESTVYPGLTEEVCGPVLERLSGLQAGRDFKLGYSPERINPGDREHTLENVVKIISAQDAESLARVRAVYGSIIKAGLYEAPSIKVAEAAKIIENTQRDLNIALMNELALIFDRLGISTREVLKAARTKWNFLGFSPGLVGGHCIGVDPYYLTTKAEQVSYQPEVILAGRRINDSMARSLAQKTMKLLVQAAGGLGKARVGILGFTFKENIRDVRNTKVVEIVRELQDFGLEVLINDPQAEAATVKSEYELELSELQEFKNLDALILAVPHREYLALSASDILGMLNRPAVLLDVKSVLKPEEFSTEVVYWSL